MSGLLLNSSHSSPTLTELTDSPIDSKVEFWSESEDYDSDAPGNGHHYLLVYSPQNLAGKRPVSVVASSRLRVLESAGPTSLYFSRYEMDEEFRAMKGLKWYWIVMIVLAALLLLLLIVLLICCCCCCACFGKQKEKREKRTKVTKVYVSKPPAHKSMPANKPPAKDVDIKSYSAFDNSVYEDQFFSPVPKEKSGSRVDNYINDHAFPKRGF